MTTRLLVITKSLMFASLAAGVGAFLLPACDTARGTPTSPAAVSAGTVAVHSPGHDDHGYIDGWFEGDDVNLHYTKSFFCAEPPASGADSNCVDEYLLLHRVIPKGKERLAKNIVLSSPLVNVGRSATVGS